MSIERDAFLKAVGKEYVNVVNLLAKDVEGQSIEIVARRVVDLERPYVPSKMLKCSQCQNDVWVDRDLLHAVDGHGVIVIQCEQCYLEHPFGEAKI